MFDELLKTLEQLDGRTIRVSIPCDEDGYLDRLCPADNCGTRFKVLADDWRDKVPEDSAWCPNCGRTESPNEFVTEAQAEYVQKVAGHELEKSLHQGLKSSAHQHNRRGRRRRPRGAFAITTEMKVTSRPPTAPTMDAWDQMNSKHDCGGCTCSFAVVGAWFYYPACGSHDPVGTFDQSVRGIRHAVAKLGDLLEVVDEDLAADLRRRTYEASLGGLVTSFQVVLDAIYAGVPNAQPAGQNTFQNLDRGSRFWVDAGGSSFETLIGDTNYSRAKLYFQRRHVLQHRDGIVDQRYLDQSGDGAYRRGERLVVRADDVLRLTTLVETLVNAIVAEAVANGW